MVFWDLRIKCIAFSLKRINWNVLVLSTISHYSYFQSILNSLHVVFKWITINPVIFTPESLPCDIITFILIIISIIRIPLLVWSISQITFIILKDLLELLIFLFIWKERWDWFFVVGDALCFITVVPIRLRVLYRLCFMSFYNSGHFYIIRSKLFFKSLISSIKEMIMLLWLSQSMFPSNHISILLRSWIVPLMAIRFRHFLFGNTHTSFYGCHWCSHHCILCPTCTISVWVLLLL